MENKRQMNMNVSISDGKCVRCCNKLFLAEESKENTRQE
jgi:hypothetical protein